MDVGLLMLVPLKEWNLWQGVLLLLSTLVAILDRIAEYLVPAEREFGAGRPAAVTVSAPLGTVRSRLARM